MNCKWHVFSIAVGLLSDCPWIAIGVPLKLYQVLLTCIGMNLIAIRMLEACYGIAIGLLSECYRLACIGMH